MLWQSIEAEVAIELKAFAELGKTLCLRRKNGLTCAQIFLSTPPGIVALVVPRSLVRGATEHEDQWSDIDLAFGVVDAAELTNVLADWTARMYDQHLALHHLDVKSGTWIYRVFLLPSTLQVDLAFVSDTEFRALAPTFRLVSGRANEPRHAPPPQPSDIIGLAWLYALHARSCITRQKPWQAEYMISGIRDHALALACIRHGLPVAHGRGIDQLPSGVTAQLESSLVRQLNAVELSRAFRVVTQLLLSELRSADSQLAGRLQEALTHLTESPQ